ncbi:hypothetical protein VTN31DRAFT_6331 [Thermomyces dupontii]|uniref:uncharacterized protein n=1 Tax=Talaromyces thermophilus TaxID=28565 RepID=UPI0037436BE6
MLGVIQFVILLCGVAISFFPDDVERIWRSSATLPQGDASLKDVIPAACHSHNDYWRPIPFFSAITSGCISIEADVWLIDNELYVAHARSEIEPDRTLRGLYIDPIVELLDSKNPASKYYPNTSPRGIFDTRPDQPLALLIDFKSDGAETWPYVVSQLSPLRDRGYLTYYNGAEIVARPVVVVVSGNAPFDSLTSNTTYRDIFYDAPLARIDHKGPPLSPMPAFRNPPQHIITTREAYNPTNSYYASASYKKSVGFPWLFPIMSWQLERIRAQINSAHRRGLKVRYWGIPSWPRRLRDHIMSILEKEGVDVLNVDDLNSVTFKGSAT